MVRIMMGGTTLDVKATNPLNNLNPDKLIYYSQNDKQLLKAN
jgi:hypothetical protein